MKLFTKKGCKKCAYVKRWIPTTGEITIYDIDTAEGLAELAYLGLIPLAEKTLPILVKGDNGIITGAINIKREIQRMIIYTQQGHKLSCVRGKMPRLFS